jgi:hypothetical protein
MQSRLIIWYTPQTDLIWFDCFFNYCSSFDVQMTDV